MAIFPIRTFGDPVLRTPATAVDVFDDDLRRLTEDMFETMYAAPGVGLAAPQIGILKRICVFDTGEGAHVMINPEVVETSDEWEYDEGCLSVPGYFYAITRPSFARAVGVDIEGNPVEFGGDDLIGRVLQHEIDHLDGMLLFDRLGKRARKSAMRDLRNDVLGMPGESSLHKSGQPE